MTKTNVKLNKGEITVFDFGGTKQMMRFAMNLF